MTLNNLDSLDEDTDENISMLTKARKPSYAPDAENSPKSSPNPSVSQAPNGEHYYRDPQSEKRRREANFKLGRILVKILNQYEIEAGDQSFQNYFQNLNSEKQKSIIIRRQEKAKSYFGVGGLFPEERKNLGEKINNRVHNIYQPYVRQNYIYEYFFNKSF